MRPARRDDGDRCAELCRQALDSLQVARGGALFARRESGLLARALLRPGGIDRLLSDARRRVLVGTVDDAVVGLAVGHLEAVADASLGVIEGCYVEPAARSVGVGRALLDGLVSWFASSGCLGVDATALPGDRSAKGFFEAAGFKARLITMHRALG
ncbi:MAG: GNAT family N-acetyltransferase [Acidimicrobiales bacterium]|jgi:GNAT superfamily N-acetyltransferase